LARTQAIKKLQRDTMEIVENPDNDVVKHSQLMYMRWCYIGLKILSLLGLTAGVFILLQPSLQAFVTGKRMLPYGFILPFVEPYGDPGYFLNWVHHALQTYFAIAALLGTLLINVNLLFHVYMQIDTMVLMLGHLSEMCLEAVVMRNVKKQQQVGAHLKKIITLHQKNSSFVKEFNEIFSFHALINILSLVFQITVTMVAVVSVG
jgi:7tm Odorant receptor